MAAVGARGGGKKGARPRQGAHAERGGAEALDGLPGDLGLLAEAAGLDAALKIARAYGGTTIYVPDLKKLLRDEAIRRECDRGATARSLAIRHRVSERCVWQILKKPSKGLHPALEKLIEDREKV